MKTNRNTRGSTNPWKHFFNTDLDRETPAHLWLLLLAATAHYHLSPPGHEPETTIHLRDQKAILLFKQNRFLVAFEIHPHIVRPLTGIELN